MLKSKNKELEIEANVVRLKEKNFKDNIQKYEEESKRIDDIGEGIDCDLYFIELL